MMDYSASLFSLEGADPQHLPSRLRLPDGQTRYSHSVTLEEVKSCGYTGPYTVPFTTPVQIAVWDSSALTYTVRDRVGDELASSLTDKLARQEIDFRLADIEADRPNFDDYLDKYVRVQFDTEEKLKNLQKSTSLLTPEQVRGCLYGEINADPNRTEEMSQEEGIALDKKYHVLDKTAAERQAAYDEWFADNENALKTEYETYGVITFVSARFTDIFRVKSSWVRGSTTLPSDYLTPQYDYRGE
jgi:hypothetical protein